MSINLWLSYQGWSTTKTSEHERVTLTDNFDHYLGLQIFFGRKKNNLFTFFFLDKVWNKIKGWKWGLFSQVEKVILLKIIVQTIHHGRAMSCFRFSKSLIDKSHKLMNAFWWGSTEENKRRIGPNIKNFATTNHIVGLDYETLRISTKHSSPRKLWTSSDSLIVWWIESSRLVPHGSFFGFIE